MKYRYIFRQFGPIGLLALLLAFISPAGTFAAESGSLRLPAGYPASRPVVDAKSAAASGNPTKGSGQVKTAPAKTAAATEKKTVAPAKGAKQPAAAESKGQAGKTDPRQTAAADPLADWQPVLARLKKDGLAGKDLEGWFGQLESGYSEKPMGSKISSMFNYRYRPFKYLRKPVDSPSMLPDVFVPSNVKKCAEFLQEHAELFAWTEKEYKVDKEIVVALFMVETRLGTYMGSEHAFWSLACMSMADKPAKIQSYVNKMHLTPARRQWVGETLQKRSEWAYKELKALIAYCRKYGHDPLAITGSPYGAIGLCQFMPSNIEAYAVDGNADGKIDLFLIEDAVPSIANFIRKHDWKPGLSRAEQHKIVRRYNHSDMYANTVLALAKGTADYLKANPKPPPAVGATSAAQPAPAAAKSVDPPQAGKPAAE